MRVVRLVSVNESGGSYPVPPPMPMYARAEAAQAADTKLAAGAHTLPYNVALTYHLQ
jgi:uncharacterized protein YggE